jgi:hypothetical protein
MSSYVSAGLRRQVAERANFLCEYCLIHEEDTFYGCQVDHIISEKHGGASVFDNLAYACASCNQAKGSDIGSLATDSDELTRFFNPRVDRWSEHFRFKDFSIVGTSRIGDATARILGFNSKPRIAERRLLYRFGRNPSPRATALMEG